jgi:hypothetical protein
MDLAPKRKSIHAGVGALGGDRIQFEFEFDASSDTLFDLADVRRICARHHRYSLPF